jgi:enoyl-CoA hydratase/carnithine racemase
MPYKYITLDVQEQVGTLRMKRPPRNLLNIPMMEEINQALLSLREYPDLAVLVIRGNKGNFCEGIDLKEHVPAKVRRMLQVYMRIFETIR